MKIPFFAFASALLIFTTIPATLKAADDPRISKSPATELGQLTYTVSSRLSPQGSRSYGPENLWQDTDSAWVEGVADDGVGEWLQITQAPDYGPMTFQTLVLHNGYQRTEKTFRENGRIREILLEWPGGSHKLKIADRMGPQKLRLPNAITTPWIRLKILSTYPGSKYADTAISGLTPDLEEFRYGAETAGGASSASDQSLAASIVGRWQGGRHLVEYRKDGTFCLDPDPAEWTPLGTWAVEGGELVERWEGRQQPERSRIISVSKTALELQADSGKFYKLNKD